MNNDNLILAAVVGVVLFFGLRGNNPAPSPTPTPSAPEYRVFVGRVTDAAHKAQLSRFFSDAAELVRRDTGRLATTDQVAKQLDVAGDLAFRGSNMGNYGVFDLAEATIAQVMGGKPSVALDAPSRAKLADALANIGAAIGG